VALGLPERGTSGKQYERPSQLPCSAYFIFALLVDSTMDTRTSEDTPAAINGANGNTTAAANNPIRA